MSNRSFDKNLTVTASIKRGDAAGKPVDVAGPLLIYPLHPPSAITLDAVKSMGLNISPHDVLETFLYKPAEIIKNGYLLQIGSINYPILWVGDWPRLRSTSPNRIVLAVQEKKNV